MVVAKTPDKTKTQNRFENQNKGMVVEEESAVKKKKKRKKTQIKCGTTNPIRVAGYVTNPPFGWVNLVPATALRKAQYTNAGFSYDLFAQLAKNLNLRINNVGYPSYQDALRDLRYGKVDVVVGMYYDKRVMGTGTNLMFPGYFTNPIIPLFVKGKERPIEKWEDLRGLKGVVRQEEMIYSLIYQQLPKDLEIEQINGSKKALLKLLKGEADYMLTSLYAGEAEVRRYKLIDEIYFSPKALVSPELFFIFTSHSDCQALKPQLSAELKKIMADDPTFRAVIEEYIDDWGMRFKDNPSLLEELWAQQRAQQNTSDIVDMSDTSDASDIIQNEDSIKFNPSDLSDETVSSDVSDNAAGQSVDGKSDTPQQPAATIQSATADVNKSPDSSDKTTSAVSTDSSDKTDKEPDTNRLLTPAERIKNL